jgi:fatty-acyl-CoA synthase
MTSKPGGTAPDDTSGVSVDGVDSNVRAGRYEHGLEQNAANHAPLTPLVFLDWSADVYPDRPSVLHGARRYTWSQTRERCRRLASALVGRGVQPGDTVAVLAANIPELYEAHFGVPMAGAVLNALNTRLDAATVAFMLEHGEASVLLVDREFAPLAARALRSTAVRPLVVDIDDSEYDGDEALIGGLDYEALLAEGDPDYRRSQPVDEWQAITLNYTSGTTGNPKGVVYHHRGAHLNAISNILAWGMPRHAVYLWTLPMFHCNGWCFPWTMAANAGTNVCLRRVTPREVLTAIREEKVTHYCGAPIVHGMLIDAPPELREGIDHTVSAMIAAAPPPASVIEGMEAMGFELTHVYGLTEVYGPSTACAPQDGWEDLDVHERARMKGRQGVRSLLQDGATVIDVETGKQVPADGQTMGEIVFRGNITMKGYLKNPTATAEAFAGGWFHSGDLAVLEPDGYIKIKDRAKDIIISGGENISSVEVEDVLYRHPAVGFCAVVATPDERWGETPQAYVELKPGAQATEAELISHCRTMLPHFKAPRRVVFGELPKTSTGKIQKHVLRTMAKSNTAFE